MDKPTEMALRWVHRLSNNISRTIQLEENSTQFLTNPSICKYYVYYRRIVDDIFRNEIVLLDRKSGQMKQIATYPSLENIEDLRIFDYNNSVWFIGFKRNEVNVWQSYLCEFNNTCTAIQQINHVFGVAADHIKNIVPLVDKNTNQLYLIDMNKANVYKYVSQNVVEDTKLDTSIIKASFPQSVLYGSTQFVALHWDNTYGALVHDLYIVLGQRYYLHHWIEIDIDEWKLTFVSKPFVLAHFGIEFATGITWDNGSNDTLKILFGLKNSCNFCTTCTLQDLRQGGTVPGPLSP
jgi:hypothetical protein